jgi:transcriptional antiterminator NusG
MAENRYDGTKQWYTLQVSSGFEDKVVVSILERAKGIDMADKIFDAITPKEKTIEIKNGRKKEIDKKIFGGYVLVEAKLDDEIWYLLRNTPGVTGFVGAGNEPSPISRREIEEIKKRMNRTEAVSEIDFIAGEVVKINDGPFKGNEGVVSEVDEKKGKLTVMVSIFGKDTPLEIDALQAKKI